MTDKTPTQSETLLREALVAHNDALRSAKRGANNGLR